MSKLYTLSQSDFIKSLVIAILAPVLTTLATALNAPGFTFASLNFPLLLKVGFIAGLSYLAKNFFSDEQGRVMGRIG